MPSKPSEIDQIREQMANIRLDLHRDVRSVRAGTEAATSWRYYVKHYPWACLAGAAALGFFIVPRRATSVKVITPPPPQPSEETKKTVKRAGLFTIALGFLGPLAVRAAQNYVVNRLDTLMVDHGAGGIGGADAARQSSRRSTGTGERGSPRTS